MSVLLLLAGVLLLWSGRRKRAGVLAVTLGTGLLLLFSSPFFPGWALRRLEQQYPYYTPAAAAGREVKWVVVLSGGSSDDPSLPLTGRLSPESIARLVEGIRIARQHPGARLFLTGGVPESIRPESHLLRELSIDLGFPRERIVIEGKTRDTEEQAVAIRQVVGRDAFVLVTSASHMARSVALCRRQGWSRSRPHRAPDPPGDAPGAAHPAQALSLGVLSGCRHHAGLRATGAAVGPAAWQRLIAGVGVGAAQGG